MVEEIVPVKAREKSEEKCLMQFPKLKDAENETAICDSPSRVMHERRQVPRGHPTPFPKTAPFPSLSSHVSSAACVLPGIYHNTAYYIVFIY